MAWRRCVTRSLAQLHAVPRCSHAVSHASYNTRHVHVAVIGSGPAGFYFIGSLLRHCPTINVDIYEKQPMPFGWHHKLNQLFLNTAHPSLEYFLRVLQLEAMEYESRMRKINGGGVDGRPPARAPEYVASEKRIQLAKAQLAADDLATGGHIPMDDILQYVRHQASNMGCSEAAMAEVGELGLARFGVAPDHPEVKNCIHQFERTIGEHRDQLQFIGNVNIGYDVTVEELRSAYDMVVCAYGAESDKKLGVPGEDATNSLSAKQFVGWYNGLPEAQDLKVDLDCEHAVVIGHGNVALDVARILLSPIDRLKNTDTTELALHTLAHSRIKRVTLVGRRGPLQISFTIKELREMINLAGSIPRLNMTDVPDLSPNDIKRLPRPRQRLTDLLIRTSRQPPTKKPSDQAKEWTLKYLRSPTRVLTTTDGASERVCGVELQINELEMDWNNLSKVMKAKVRTRTDCELETLPCELLFTSIGYRSVQMPGLPYDAKRNVIETESDGTRVKDMPSVYAVGWCAHSATGVIATTQTESASAAQLVAMDVEQMQHRALTDVSQQHKKKRGHELMTDLLSKRGIPWVSWPEWMVIDEKEQQLGHEHGKPREKYTNVRQILDVLHKQ